MRPRTSRLIASMLGAIAGFIMALMPAPASALTCGTVLSPLSVSATGVNFGIYDPLSQSSTQSEGSIVVACDLGVDVLPAFTASLSSGTASHFSPRMMTSGASTLNYNLYTMASRTTVWGDGTSDTETQSYNGLIVFGNAELTVYGAVPPGQFVNAGTYADTIVVTIEY